MKIRIFALAKELGLDSKELIDVCNQAGIELKNSALASISPEERDIVVGFIKNSDAPAAPAPQHQEAPRAPIREEQKDRDIRNIAGVKPRLQQTHPEVESPMQPVAQVPEGVVALAEPPESEVEVEAETEEEAVPDVVEAPLAEEAEVAAEVVDEPQVEAAPVVDDAAVEVKAEAEVTTTEVKVPEEAAPAAEVPQKTEKQPEKPAAMSRSDYVSPGGGNLPEMKPIGTISADQRQRRASQKSAKKAMPSFAAPPKALAVKAKKPAESAQKTQKPTIAFSDMSGPLSGYRQKAQDTTEQPAGAAAQRGGAQRGGQRTGGSSLRDRYKKEQKSFKDDLKLRRGKRNRRNRQKAELKTSAQIEMPISVRSLSEAIGRPAKSIMGLLLKEGKLATINGSLGEEESIELAMELGVDLEVKRGRDIEQELADRLDHPDPDESKVERPPIVTILGHVDHGKTTLIDKLRSARVADGEAGGITQHIASYQVERNGKKVTFVDTPGHAAFGEMRARGANVTDIIVLVVAADDGVMPQTVECIAHAKVAGVPIIVALNKIDLPGIDENRIFQQLTQHEIVPAEWGGEYEVVRTSGETGQGLDDLIETIQLTAELNEFKACPEREGFGVCLEAFMDEGRGPIAWMIVQKGTLRIGDLILCGGSYGRVRAMYDDQDNEIIEAGPSTPVKVAGLDSVPDSGSHFFEMDDVEEAREVAAERRDKGRHDSLAHRGGPTDLEKFFAKGKVTNLPLILKADSPGSVEALRGEIEKFEHPEVQVEILHEGVGGVNESDVSLASAARAIIIAFHVIAEDRAEVLAETEGVEIRRYEIIYEVTEHIKLALEGLLKPEKVEISTGRAVVLRTFNIGKAVIAGCRILQGTIERNNRVRLIRDQKILRNYPINSLRREKDDVKTVRDGMECGIRLEGFNDIKEGDMFEAYRVDEVQRTLESSAAAAS